MTRYKITIEYNGSNYLGWQKQQEGPSVQAEIETAYKKILGENIKLQVAGRTDKGVHATGQVAHFDANSTKRLIEFWDGANYHLPKDICITKVEEVPADFHARHSATARAYQYIIFNRRHISPLWYKKAGHVCTPLNFNLMEEALKTIPLGENDWSAFRSSECQSTTPMVDLHSVSLTKEGSNIIKLDIQANHFLHNMIRILVGTLVEIGTEKRPPQNIPELLISKNRAKAGETFSPNGLYFRKVTYNLSQ